MLLHRRVGQRPARRSRGSRTTGERTPPPGETTPWAAGGGGGELAHALLPQQSGGTEDQRRAAGKARTPGGATPPRAAWQTGAASYRAPRGRPPLPSTPPASPPTSRHPSLPPRWTDGWPPPPAPPHSLRPLLVAAVIDAAAPPPTASPQAARRCPGAAADGQGRSRPSDSRRAAERWGNCPPDCGEGATATGCGEAEGGGGRGSRGAPGSRASVPPPPSPPHLPTQSTLTAATTCIPPASRRGGGGRKRAEPQPAATSVNGLPGRHWRPPPMGAQWGTAVGSSGLTGGRRRGEGEAGRGDARCQTLPAPIG